MSQYLKTGAGLALAFAVSGLAQAGATIKIDDTRSLSIGAGLRTSFNSVEDAAPSGRDRSNDFELDSIRLYLSGQIHENIKFTFNTERDEDGEVNVLDGIAQFEFSDRFNVWMGRMLPPSDRSNLSGPYYLNAWTFPIAQRYPAIIAGRDEGLSVWGSMGARGGQLKYQVGLFEGRQDAVNDDDNLMFAGRITYNFWDPEPGYYNSSTYYGEKDILAIGFAYMSQEDGAGDAGAAPVTRGDFTGWNFDVLMEKKLGSGGVLSVEGAYYDYDLDNVADANNLVQGDGFFVLGAYLLPNKVGIGQLQPMVRYQELDLDAAAGDREKFEVGLNYIIKGHDARVSFVIGETDVQGGPDFDEFRVGVQLQL